MSIIRTDIALLVTGNRAETTGCRSILFERPHNFDYKAGDWINLNLSSRNLKGGRTYSLSSSPTEPYLMITFKDGLSEIKRALAELAPGDRIHINQYGNDYDFKLKEHRTAVLIAGGVGVAPFRSMIKELVDSSLNPKVLMIYINKNPQRLFHEEFAEWSSLLSEFNIVNIYTEGLNKKAREKVLISSLDNIDGIFYISGPEAMVENTEHLLLEQGVSISDIKIDIFSGY